VSRRRVVVAITLAAGTVLLGLSLSIPPGELSFSLVSLAVAVTWLAGGLLSGPLPLGQTTRRAILTAVLIGLLAAAVFVAGAFVVREIPPLRDYVTSVLSYADNSSLALITLVTVANGLGEEVFFRGALFAAIGPRGPVLLSTAIYALVTVATGNPMLVFAALTLGLVLAWQRRSSGGVLAPMVTHVTWSTIMLYALPAIPAG
jgi:uncharacterized protein